MKKNRSIVCCWFVAIIANLSSTTTVQSFVIPNHNNPGGGYGRLLGDSRKPSPSIGHDFTLQQNGISFIRNAVAVSNANDEYIEAEDIAAIQGLFAKYCDKEGLMSLDELQKVPPFTDMLSDGDLLLNELKDIWDAAPKFPDVAGDESRIDVDAFVRIYRDVDDLFEDDKDKVAEENDAAKNATNDESDIPMNPADESVEEELEKVFETLCGDDNLVSKETLAKWEEITKLIAEGLLDEEEFNDLWSKTPKSPGSSDQLDVDGFLSFNVALDGLFEFDDDEEDDKGDDATTMATTTPSVETSLPATSPVAKKQMVEGDDLPPGVLFAAIADETYLVGMDELKQWAELQDMLAEGDLLPSELQSLYDSCEKSESGKLTEVGFIDLTEKIDALFEDEDDDGSTAAVPEASGTNTVEQKNVVKEDLLTFVELIKSDLEEDSLPCGLDSTEKDQKQVLSIVTALEGQPSNLIKQKNGKVDEMDLAGTWELIYSSSSAMRFNQGLSGLGGSFPNGRFAGLKQKLIATKFVRDVEYLERIAVNPAPASFDVSVTGSWDLKTSMSLFTGQPSIVLNIEPDRVNYGPTSTRADHWKSLGPTNMLDLTYLDSDFRVMRGCTSTDTILLFKKSAD